MTVLSFLRELYSLETLDTRFTNSSSTPIKPANVKDDGSKPGSARGGKSPPAEVTLSRLEFWFYIAVISFCVPQMYWAVVTVSQRKHLISYLDMQEEKHGA